MACFVGPCMTYPPEVARPPGIDPQATGWAHLVSNESQAELEAFLTANLATIACPVENVRTPAAGSLITYVALSEAQRVAAVEAGAGPTPLDGMCRMRSFDKFNGATWEPPA